MYRILLLVFLLSCLGARAQSEDFDSYTEKPLSPKSFDDNKYQKAVEGLDYYEAPPEEKESRNYHRPRSTLFTGVPLLVKGIFFLLVIGLLAFIIYKLLGGQMELQSKKINRSAQVSIEDLEKNLHHADLQRFLQEALDAGNLRLAVRIYYLMVLRTLSERNLIQWSIDKTNREYVREMQGHPSRQEFRDLTRWFEQIWYGNYPIPHTRYQQLDQSFRDILGRLTSKSLPHA